MRKSRKVLQIEERFGKDIADILAETYRKFPSDQAAAEYLGIARPTYRTWLYVYRILDRVRGEVEHSYADSR